MAAGFNPLKSGHQLNHYVVRVPHQADIGFNPLKSGHQLNIYMTAQTKGGKWFQSP